MHFLILSISVHLHDFLMYSIFISIARIAIKLTIEYINLSCTLIIPFPYLSQFLNFQFTMKNENNNFLNYRVFLKYLIRYTSVYQTLTNYINYYITNYTHIILQKIFMLRHWPRRFQTFTTWDSTLLQSQSPIIGRILEIRGIIPSIYRNTRSIKIWRMLSHSVPTSEFQQRRKLYRGSGRRSKCGDGRVMLSWRHENS